MNTMKIAPAGDCALVVEFENRIAPEINAQVHRMYKMVKDKKIPGVQEMIPTFRSLLVSYEPSVISYDKLKKKLEKLGKNESVEIDSHKRIFEIPVCYEGDFCPDMENVMLHTGLERDEIIKLHSGPDYLIYMLGFLPGFAYLGGLDPRIFTPRLASPRTIIEPGSVGIGGEQTGIYPLASPGGWQLIGRTPILPYDQTREQPFLYQAGDYIRFSPVSFDTYKELEQKQAKGEQIYRILKEGETT